MDGRNPAPPKKPKADSPCKCQQKQFRSVFTDSPLARQELGLSQDLARAIRRPGGGLRRVDGWGNPFRASILTSQVAAKPPPQIQSCFSGLVFGHRKEGALSFFWGTEKGKRLARPVCLRCFQVSPPSPVFLKPTKAHPRNRGSPKAEPDGGTSTSLRALSASPGCCSRCDKKAQTRLRALFGGTLGGWWPNGVKSKKWCCQMICKVFISLERHPNSGLGVPVFPPLLFP